ncbi:helix-turn-helix domain-containing protein [Paenibacillus sp. OV219]|uniref:winged helix-turn-helix transcriptional regulator n=1 Tax=Paenibacillus sp. OV219 TaxID=1884377 RepID=UPI0008D69819|nr:winged helix-turn-helix transcriptional regulator [Paenibacillus sp. OV219]SEM72581.1 transcriptional regulator, HxlR family [Paenibacillus sp. OV219]
MSENCEFTKVLEILGGKWKPSIMYQLFMNGTMRFSELQRALPEITKKMLTTQLRELEYHDIVNRKIYMQIPPKVEYSMTEHGSSLTPVLMAMNDWGKAHLEHLHSLHGERQPEQEVVSENVNNDIVEIEAK